MKMLKLLSVAVAFAASALALPANAQNFPNKPIRIVVGFAPGGIGDITARLVSPKLGAILGVPVLVENRPGAAGHVGAGLVAKSEPDGYTLFFTTPGTVGIVPHFRKDLTYHMIDDFEYVGIMSAYHNFLITSPDFAKDMKTFVEKVKAAPGKYNAATVGIGGFQHLYFIVQNDVLGLKTEYVNYNGPVQGNESIGKMENAIAFTSYLAGKPQFDGGKVIPIAVMSEHRSQAMPNVPTITEAGYPDLFKAGNWSGRQFVMAPKGTPKAVIDKLHAAIQQAMQDPDIKLRLKELDLDDTSAIPPEKAKAEARAEYENWGRIIKKYDIKDQ